MRGSSFVIKWTKVLINCPNNKFKAIYFDRQSNNYFIAEKEKKIIGVIRSQKLAFFFFKKNKLGLLKINIFFFFEPHLLLFETNWPQIKDLYSHIADLFFKVWMVEKFYSLNINSLALYYYSNLNNIWHKTRDGQPDYEGQTREKQKGEGQVKLLLLYNQRVNVIN